MTDQAQEKPKMHVVEVKVGDGNTHIVVDDPATGVRGVFETALPILDVMPMVSRICDAVQAPTTAQTADKFCWSTECRYRDLHMAAEEEVEQLRAEVELQKKAREADREELTKLRAMNSALGTQVRQLTDENQEWQKVARAELNWHEGVRPADLRWALNDRVERHRQEIERLGEHKKAEQEVPELDIWRVLRTAYDELASCYEAARPESLMESAYDMAHTAVRVAVSLNGRYVKDALPYRVKDYDYKLDDK